MLGSLARKSILNRLPKRPIARNVVCIVEVIFIICVAADRALLIIVFFDFTASKREIKELDLAVYLWVAHGKNSLYAHRPYKEFGRVARVAHSMACLHSFSTIKHLAIPGDCSRLHGDRVLSSGAYRSWFLVSLVCLGNIHLMGVLVSGAPSVCLIISLSSPFGTRSLLQFPLEYAPDSCHLLIRRTHTRNLSQVVLDGCHVMEDNRPSDQLSITHLLYTDKIVLLHHAPVLSLVTCQSHTSCIAFTWSRL